MSNSEREKKSFKSLTPAVNVTKLFFFFSLLLPSKLECCQWQAFPV
jgi:hypothetical protein